MARTTKELGDDFDTLANQVEVAVDKLTAKLEALSQSQNTIAVAVGSVQTDVGSLKQTVAQASLNSLHADVASLKTTIANTKMVGVAAAIVAALLGGTGVWQIVKTQLEVRSEQAQFKALSEKADKLIAQHALMMKDSLIDKIEYQLNSEASLDALKDKPQLQRIQADIKELEALNSNLPPNSQSKYFMIGKALTAFLNDNCGEALKILDQIDGADRNFYGYAYMQGACYLRTHKPDLAVEAFAKASKLTSEGKRVQMTLNAQGASALAVWKSLRVSRPREAEEALDNAIAQFEYLRKSYPDYAAAHFNLACAYASRRNYEKASVALGELRVFQSPESIAKDIQDDLLRPSEAYLTEYVREELQVKRPPGDSFWKQDVITNLPARKPRP